MKKYLKKILFIFTIIILGFFFINSDAKAATITVNSLSDIGPGNCDTTCTFRDAIATSLEGDTITFADNVRGTILFTQDASIHIDHTLNVQGPGSLLLAIDGNNDGGNYIDINDSSLVVTLSGLTFQNFKDNSVIYDNNSTSLTLSDCTFKDNPGSGYPGALYVGGGNLIVINSTFSNNSSDYPGAILIEGSGNMSVTNSTFLNNTSTGNGGGGAVNFNSSGEINISGSNFSGNTARAGGGIYLDSGDLNVSNSTFTENSVGNDYGSVLVNNGNSVIISNSTFDSNTGGYDLIEAGSHTTITNSTFANNTSIYGSAGPLNDGGSVDIINSTFYNNVGTQPTLAGVNIINSIIYSTSGNNCDTGPSGVTSRGNNIDSGNSCGFTAEGDLINTDPLLGTLADNSGPVKTIALLAGSPAINAGATSADIPTTDARGLSRVLGPDIGAYEYQSIPVATQISTCAQFENINNRIGGNYVLTADLNCISQGNNIMVGTDVNPFSGTFDGQNHYINIAINKTAENNVGLFRTATNASISNLIINGIVHGGANYVGVLVGYGTNLNIDNVINNASVSGGGNVGGLVGRLDTDLGNVIVTNSHSTGNVSGTNGNVGGLFGGISTNSGDAIISNSSSSGAIDGGGAIGGLVGYLCNCNGGDIITISNSFSTSIIVATGSGGGIIGSLDNEGNGEADDRTAVTINNSYHMTGDISTSGSSVGGLVGYAYQDYSATTNMINSYASGIISGSNGNVGGLVGYYESYEGVINITGNHFSGNLESNSSNVGGVVGYMYVEGGENNIESIANISNNYSTGIVSGKSEVGGILGYADIEGRASDFPFNFIVEKNYSTANITGVNANVGGLVGRFEVYNQVDQALTFNFNQNYAKSTITAGNGTMGGLIGTLYSDDKSTNGDKITGIFNQNYFKGIILDDISLSSGIEGGLFGQININDNSFVPFIISNSYADVDITGMYYTGGLVGIAAGLISFIDDYATGTIKGGSGSGVGGGLVGELDGDGVSIINSIALTNISSDFTSDTGAIIGNVNNNTPTFSNSFYDQILTGQTYCTGDGGVVSNCTPRNTAEEPDTNYFKSNHISAPFTNWDFNTIWRTNINGYPTLNLAVLPVLATPTATSITQTSATLSGSFTDTGGRDITARGFNYGTSIGYGNNITDNGTYGMESFTKDIASLSCSTTYHYRSFATTSVGTGYGADAIFTTANCSRSGGGGGRGNFQASTASTPVNNLIPNPKISSVTQKENKIEDKIIRFVFTKTLQLGSKNNEVLQLQKYLNTHGFLIAKTGVGSLGNETNYFGKATREALGQFQLKNKIIAKKTSAGYGIFGPATRKFVNKN